LECLRTPADEEPEGSGEGRRPFKLDLLLGTQRERRPILAEVKINNDEDAFYALVQVLAAAAYLMSNKQRDCLARHYGGELELPRSSPFFDLRVILFRDREHPLKGRREGCLIEAMALATKLEQHVEVAAFVREIRFVDSWLAGDRLYFASAGTNPILGDPLQLSAAGPALGDVHP
jgi:hypothetical protein